MVKLQKPAVAFMGGKLIPWDEAVLHVGSEAVLRCASVFEGLKGYWNLDGVFNVVEINAHYDRLCQSAKLLALPFSWSYEEYKSAIFEITNALLNTENDMWLRTTLFAIEGHWGLDTETDLVITAFQQSKAVPTPINLGISTWQRSRDLSLPARVKTAANYQVGRLARMEGRKRDFQEMILLNSAGRVSEGTGSCILVVRDGVIYTPPAYEGTLSSITVSIAERIAKLNGIEFLRRPIERTELFIADELCICGTLAEFVPVKNIDGYDVDPYGPVLTKIRDQFFETVRGKLKSDAIALDAFS